jgi:hypothetical protein
MRLRIPAAATAACLAATSIYASTYALPQRAGRTAIVEQSGKPVLCDPASTGLEAAGSNFILSSVGRYNETRVLTDDAVKPPFVEILENPQKVKAQLAKLYEAGQRKISTVIWHTPLIGQHAGKSRRGYLVNSDGGLRADIKAGLEAYFQAVKQTGFRDVVVRFGPQGCAHPSRWAADNRIKCPVGYSEAIADDNYSIIATVHGMLDRIFAGTDVARWYDLAVEGVGWQEPFPTYNARIWARYVRDFGAADTYGFSIAYQPGRLTQIYQIYGESGVRPAVIAVDMYDGRTSRRRRAKVLLAELAGEMDKLGLRGTPVVLQESFYNHEPTYQAVIAARQAGMNIRAIYQWPMDTSDTWHDTPYRYDAYCPALANGTAATQVTLEAHPAGEQNRVR